ncbi:MAG: Argininosuccinate synthase [Phycisphaerae bacterium]|nr:Argininosuccinate synthase [Phycisphaerae bacterium]
MNPKQCVVGFSGGLDTSAIVPWLVERGYEVHAVVVDVGQDEDLAAAQQWARQLGAQSACCVDVTPALSRTVLPYALGLAATYEGYRLGTALTRPLIALAQVQVARQLGATTLVHGATGKGNDQIRFEYAYRSLAPEMTILAPWKVWAMSGRQDLVEYLQSRGINRFPAKKEYSLDENLWHLSVEGSALENPSGELNVEQVLAAVKERFAGGDQGRSGPEQLQITFEKGTPVAVNGEAWSLLELISQLNRWYRGASWAWDLIIENRFTGIKSRGLYINPAARLLHTAADALARCALSKPLYDQYVRLGHEYASLLYRGEYFSAQRQVVEAAADSVLSRMSGTVTLRLQPQIHAMRIDCPGALFTEQLATFEKSSYAHADAGGFIRLSWLANIGQPFQGETDDDLNLMETGCTTPSTVCTTEPLSVG